MMIAVRLVLARLLAWNGVLAGAMALAADGPQLQLDTGGHMALVMHMAFTPDGKQLVSGSNDKTIRVWDLETGKTVRTIRGQISPGPEGKIYTMALSPDGKWLAVGGFMAPGFGVRDKEVGDIRLYDFASGDLIARLKGHSGVVQGLAFSPDSRLLVSGSGLGDMSAMIWDVEKRTLLRRLEGHVKEIYSVAFTPDGERIVTAAYDHEVRLWNVADGSMIKLMLGHQEAIHAIAVSPKDGTIASASNDGEILLWDGKTGDFRRLISKRTTNASSLTFSPDGRYLLTGPGSYGYDRECLVFDIEKGEVATTYKGHDNIVLATGISPDGRWAATSGGSRFPIHIWDLRSGERRKGPDGNPLDLTGVGFAIWSVGIDPSGASIAWGGNSQRIDPIDRGPLELSLTLPGDGRYLGRPKLIKDKSVSYIRGRADHAGLSLRCRDGSVCPTDSTLVVLEKGKELARIERQSWDGYDHRAYTISPDGQTIVSGGSNGVLVSYDRKGKQKRQFIGHTGDLWAVAISADGRMLISGSADQTVRLWNLATGEPIVTLFQGLDANWVLWTQEGYYAASPQGDDLVGWQINRGPERAAEYIHASQLKKHFFRPDIVSQAIELASATKAVQEATETEFSLAELIDRRPPAFEIVPPEPSGSHDKNQMKVRLKVASTADKIEGFEVMVNGRQTTGRAAVAVEVSGGEQELTVPLSQGENAIRITAFNAVGKTVRELVVNHAGEGALEKRGTLYLVAIGVDEYPKLGQNLNYAGKDAKAFHETILKTVGPLHADVKSLLLTNANQGEPGAERLVPTADNIVDVLDFFKESKPEDTVILFLAGHGVNDGPNYYFLPTDAEQRDGRWRKSSVVRWTDLETAINDARGRRIMFVDTCHSGNAYNQRLLKDASDANIVVFSATDSETLAQEVSELGHGVFTYSILQALTGAADFMRDGNINLLELGFYVSNEVRRITRAAQEPVFHLSGAKDFIFARM